MMNSIKWLVWTLMANLWLKLSHSQSTTTLSEGTWTDDTPFSPWSRSDRFTHSGTPYHGEFDNIARLNRSFTIEKPDNNANHDLTVTYSLLFACNFEETDEVVTQLYLNTLWKNAYTHVRTDTSNYAGNGGPLVDVCTGTDDTTIWYDTYTLALTYNSDDFVDISTSESVDSVEFSLRYTGTLSTDQTNEYWAVYDISIEIVKQDTNEPTGVPTSQPSMRPTTMPSSKPTSQPTGRPTNGPTSRPTGQPTMRPSNSPTMRPSVGPTMKPSSNPTMKPSSDPTMRPTAQPSVRPTGAPTDLPSIATTGQPTSSTEAPMTTQTGTEETKTMSVTPYTTEDGDSSDDALSFIFFMSTMSSTLVFDPDYVVPNEEDDDDFFEKYIDLILGIFMIPAVMIPSTFCFVCCLIAACQNIYFNWNYKGNAYDYYDGKPALTSLESQSNNAIIVVE